MRSLLLSISLLVLLTACDSPQATNTSISGNTSTNTSAEDTKTETGSTKTSTSKVSTPDNWTYSENEDEMRGTSSKTAQVESKDEFPNMFGMNMEPTALFVRRKAGSLDVAISNSNLQFECNSFSSTHVAVKFDSGPVSNYPCTGSKGSTYGLAFIESEARFLKNLRGAKKVIIEAEVYQKGEVQQHFDVAGLKF